MNVYARARTHKYTCVLASLSPAPLTVSVTGRLWHAVQAPTFYQQSGDKRFVGDSRHLHGRLVGKDPGSLGGIKTIKDFPPNGQDDKISVAQVRSCSANGHKCTSVPKCPVKRQLRLRAQRPDMWFGSRIWWRPDPRSGRDRSRSVTPGAYTPHSRNGHHHLLSHPVCFQTPNPILTPNP